MNGKPIECPFSVVRLQEMYVVEGQSVALIAATAGEILGRTIYGITVRRWLDEAGVPRRSLSDAVRVAHRLGRLHPTLENLTHGSPRRASRREAIAMSKKSAKLRAQRANETRKCCICGDPVTRPRYKFQGKKALCEDPEHRKILTAQTMQRQASICSIVGCANKPVARGLCQKHYMQWFRAGGCEQALAEAKAVTHGG